MTFSKGVIEEALKAIREGVDIVTDTNMAKSGISHKWQRSFLVRLIVIWQTVMLPVKLAKREVTRANSQRGEGGKG